MSKQFAMFCYLLLFTIVNPSMIASLPMVPITLLTLLFLAGYKLYRNRELWSYYRLYIVEVMLFCGYIAISLLSLALNLTAYDTFEQIVYFGVTPIAVTFSIALLVLVFNPANANMGMTEKPQWFYLTIIVFVFVAAVGIWQYIDYDSSKAVTQFFVASELSSALDNQNVRSVFRVSTDFGPLMAVISIALLCRFNQLMVLSSNRWYKVVVCALLVLLFFFAGFLSGSRNFLISFIVGLAVFLLMSFKKKRIWIGIVGLSVVMVSHALILSSETLRQKYSAYLPYMEKLYHGKNLQAKDFIPVLDSSNLSGRFDLWQRAVEEVSESPLIGISNGAYKLSENSTSKVDNTHNLLFQVLVDSGYLGLLFIVILLYRIHSLIDDNKRPIFWTILISLMFDYYLDHSMPWLICVSWLYFYVVVNQQTPAMVKEGFDRSSAVQA